MPKTCQRCGHLNDDDRAFCQQCGEPMDANIRVLMSYEKMKKAAPQPTQAKVRRNDDDDYVPVKREKKKESHVAVWVALACLVVVAGVAAYFLLSR